MKQRDILKLLQRIFKLIKSKLLLSYKLHDILNKMEGEVQTEQSNRPPVKL